MSLERQDQTGTSVPNSQGVKHRSPNHRRHLGQHMKRWLRAHPEPPAEPAPLRASPAPSPACTRRASAHGPSQTPSASPPNAFLAIASLAPLGSATMTASTSTISASAPRYDPRCTPPASVMHHHRDSSHVLPRCVALKPVSATDQNRSCERYKSMRAMTSKSDPDNERTLSLSLHSVKK